MKKLFVILAAGLLFSCSNDKTSQNGQSESISIDSSSTESMSAPDESVAADSSSQNASRTSRADSMFTGRDSATAGQR